MPFGDSTGGTAATRIKQLSPADSMKIREKQQGSGKAKVIQIDYETFQKENAVFRDAGPQDTSDGQLMMAVRNTMQMKARDERKCFNTMLISKMGSNQHEELKRSRVSVKDFLDQLEKWKLAFNRDQLQTILQTYENTPNEGLDFSDFCDIAAGEEPSHSTTRRFEHTQQLEVQKAKPLSRSAASNVLSCTSASVPSGKYSTYDKTIPLYGCGNGLDINTDGTNNGYFN